MVAPGNRRNGFLVPYPFVKSQADSIQQAGWKVFLSIVDDRTSFGGVLRNFRRIRREVAHVQPDIIHAQYGSVTAAVAYCVKGYVPLVVSFCGDDLLGTPNPGWLWRVREKGARIIGLAASCGAAAIVAKSSNLLGALPSSLRSKAVVLPNGVNMSWFVPLDKDQARGKLGWPKGERVILFNASGHTEAYRKNFPLAQESVGILARSVRDVTLRQMCDVSPDEVPWMLNAADCLLVTSLHEGSPNIVKEAMACNLPVVSVPCGDVVERLKGTNPGKICPYDANSLAEAMREVLRMGCRSNGREQLVAQGLSAVRVAERLVQIYSAVQEGRPVPVASFKSACVE